MCPQSDGVVVGFVHVSCDVDSNLLKDLDLSEFEGLYRQTKEDEAAAQSDSEEPQVTSRHPNTFSLHLNAAWTQLSAFLPNRRILRGAEKEVLQMKPPFSRSSSLLLTRITR